MSIQINTTMTVRQTMAVAQVIPQYRHTEGQGRRKLLTPDEVLRLPNEELLCIVRGHNILKLNKLDYTKHPMSKQINRVSIMDYQPTPYSHTDFYNQREYEKGSMVQPPGAKNSDENNDDTKPISKNKLYSSAMPPDEF